MQSARTSIVAGLALMGVGLLWLLDALGVLAGAVVIPPLIFAAVGLSLAVLFVRHRSFWWAAIPGSVFLGLAAVILASQAGAGGRAGAFLFVLMAAGFAAIFLRVPGFWWALIPCGVMLTMAVVVALPAGLPDATTAAVFFLGLAGTFAVLALVPVRGEPGSGASPAAAGGTPVRAVRMRWPLAPAAVLAVLGVVFLVQAAAVLVPSAVVVPAVVILAGIALLVYAVRAHRHGGNRPHGA